MTKKEIVELKDKIVSSLEEARKQALLNPGWEYSVYYDSGDIDIRSGYPESPEYIQDLNNPDVVHIRSFKEQEWIEDFFLDFNDLEKAVVNHMTADEIGSYKEVDEEDQLVFLRKTNAYDVVTEEEAEKILESERDNYTYEEIYDEFVKFHDFDEES